MEVNSSGKTKKKRGRPKGSGKFNTEYRLRIETNEYEKLRKISELTGLPISKIVRELISDFISKFDIKEF